VGCKQRRLWSAAKWVGLGLLALLVCGDFASVGRRAGIDLGFAGLTVAAGRLGVYWQPERSSSTRVFAGAGAPGLHDWWFSIHEIAYPRGALISVPLWSIAVPTGLITAWLWWRHVCKRGGTLYAAKWAALALTFGLLCIEVTSTRWAVGWAGTHHTLGLESGSLKVGWGERQLDWEAHGIWLAPPFHRWWFQRYADSIMWNEPFPGAHSGRADWLFIPLWPVTLLGTVPAAWLWFRALHAKRHRCVLCGYDLKGLPSGRIGTVICPECGRVTAGAVSV